MNGKPHNNNFGQGGSGLIPRETIDEIRNRVSIAEVVRGHVQLKRKGRDLWGCCPFHNEKSPSFQVRDAEGYYHCFGCGAHGNAFDFVQQIQGLTFPDAVEYLAGKAGVTIRREKANPVKQKQKVDGFGALERATVHFERGLKGEALDYLYNRGLSKETINTFRLGYAPDEWRELKTALTAESYNDKIMLDTGLIRTSDKGGEPYDTFRGRVMFPIQDMQGRPVAFGGRVMDGSEPKYLNSSETPFFKKSNILYGLYHAAPQIRRTEQAIIVEGYMDVIGLYQHGVQTAVAPMGTAITEDQVALLWRYNDAPFVCLDGDSAGRKAASRLAQRVLRVLTTGKGLRFAWMPEGEDPDSFIAAQGTDAFNEVLKNAVTLEDVLWQDLTDGYDLKTGHGRAAVEKAIADTVSQIQDELVRKHMNGALRDRMWQTIRQAPQGSQNQKAGQKGFNKNFKKPAGPTGPTTDRNAGAVEQVLLALVLHNTAVLEGVGEPFARLNFSAGRLQYLQEQLLKFLSPTGVDTSGLEAHLRMAGLESDVLDLKKRTGVEKLLADNNISEKHELERFWLSLYAETEASRSKKRATAAFLERGGENVANDLDAWQKFKAAKLKGIDVGGSD